MTQDAAAIVRAHAAFVWRALRHLGVPPDQLEDVSQEVLIAVCRGLAQFRGQSLLTTWIYGICRNMAADARRKRRHAREQLHERPPELAVAETQSHELARHELAERLERALATLAEPARMVFVLFEIERLPMAEVASALGCTPSTAYSRLYDAREHVKRAFLRAGLIDETQSLAEVM
jgi:RNA polymerase sigma-70 factor, ECF subfamily